MESFITGSYAYGNPRDDSDVDLVVKVCPETAALLREKSPSGIPTRFGNLNLILCETDLWFESWKRGTEELMERMWDQGRPIPKNEAREHFEKLRLELGLTPDEAQSRPSDTGPGAL